jgi:hypothetical protein
MPGVQGEKLAQIAQQNEMACSVLTEHGYNGAFLFVEFK